MLFSIRAFDATCLAATVERVVGLRQPPPFYAPSISVRLASFDYVLARRLSCAVCSLSSIWVFERRLPLALRFHHELTPSRRCLPCSLLLSHATDGRRQRKRQRRPEPKLPRCKSREGNGRGLETTLATLFEAPGMSFCNDG